MVMINNKQNMKSFIVRIVLAAAVIISVCNATPTSITAPPVSKNTIGDEKDDLKQFLGHCLHKGDVSKCLKNRVAELLDEVITNNEDWSVNFFNMRMSLSKNPDFKEEHASENAEKGRTFEDIISRKLKNLMESRVFQVKLADDDTETKNSNEAQTNEGRKKKEGKHGHMMMMSGELIQSNFISLLVSHLKYKLF